jgi:hypothetical protein
VEYTVRAEDGTTVKKYTVSIIQTAKVTDGNLKAVLDQITKGGSYDIEMASNNAGFAPYSIPAGTYAKPKNIALYGSGGVRTISLSSNQKGSLLTVGQYVTVNLKDITLQGISDNNAALVRVEVLGNLVLESGAKITGNTNTTSSTPSNSGGGIFSSSGTILINGGEISDNTSNYGGGGIYVYLSVGGQIILNSGKISNNTATSYGGGVYGNITVNGGEISGNNAVQGGGVDGNVTMTGGSIKNNKAEGSGSILIPSGGGVYGKVIMSGGTIEGNSAVSTASNPLRSPSRGGGIYSGSVLSGEDSVLSGGTITNNTASIGGGIYIPASGSLKMSKDIVVTPATSTNDVSTNAIALTFYKSSATPPVVTNATITVAEAFSGSGVIANVDIFRDGAIDWPDVFGRTVITGNIDASTLARFALVKSQIQTGSSYDLQTGNAEGNFKLGSDGKLAQF